MMSFKNLLDLLILTGFIVIVFGLGSIMLYLSNKIYMSIHKLPDHLTIQEYKVVGLDTSDYVVNLYYRFKNKEAAQKFMLKINRRMNHEQ